MDRIPDPYRELGILRGATDAQVKAAHRRLAKRFHPDAPEGDHDRFLAIQEAYSLLSDPLRRRDWDAKHTAGPVRAGDPGPRRGGRGAATPRPARQPGSSGARRGAGGGGPGGRPAGSGTGGRGDPAGAATASGASGSGDDAPGTEDATNAGGAWSASDRDPASRSTTWSAAGVPWWEDFSPRDHGSGSAGAGSGGTAGGPTPGRGAGPAQGGAASDRSKGTTPEAPHAGGSAHEGAGPGAAAGAGSGAGTATGGHRTTAHRSPEDVDVYSRSSGAAWSMAARRYFRKGEAELPKGGAWTYRGTQVVTGAEARKVNEEEAARRRAAEALLRSRATGTAAPRTAFGHDEAPASPTASSARSRAGAPVTQPAPHAPTPRSPRPTSTRPSAAAETDRAPSPATVRSAPATSAAADASFLRRVRRVLRLGG